MATLVLEDGSVLRGQPFGAAVSTAGEVGKQDPAGCRPHPTLCCPSLPSVPCPAPAIFPPANPPPPAFSAHVPSPAQPLSSLTVEAAFTGAFSSRGSVFQKVPCLSPSPASLLQCFKPVWSATPRLSLTLPTKHRS